ncbi:MAG: HIT family protein, partial [Cyclobacteriaceae bacterium]|nr:HIT family protein [Cyclobacteriaceae bacterium]
DETLTGLHLFAKKVAHALKKVTGCKRVAVAVLGLEVPHAHVHLVPMNQMSEANFANPKLKLSQEELAGIAARIRSEFSA